MWAKNANTSRNGSRKSSYGDCSSATSPEEYRKRSKYGRTQKQIENPATQIANPMYYPSMGINNYNYNQQGGNEQQQSQSFGFASIQQPQQQQPAINIPVHQDILFNNGVDNLQQQPPNEQCMYQRRDVLHPINAEPGMRFYNSMNFSVREVSEMIPEFNPSSREGVSVVRWYRNDERHVSVARDINIICCCW